MWTMEGDSIVPQYYNKLKVFEEETYALLRVRLEEKSAMKWLFEFWENDNKCRIRQKMEDLNDVVTPTLRYWCLYNFFLFFFCK